MKRLVLLRHAKSSWADPGSSDLERPLNARGRAAAERMGEWLRDQQASFDLVVASPAVRVTETLEQLAVGYGSRFEVEFRAQIYEAALGTMLSTVRAIPEPVRIVLMVGHCPGLQLLALDLARPDAQGLRGQVAAKLPTAGLVEIRLDAAEWGAVGPETGEITAFHTPKMLGCN